MPGAVRSMEAWSLAPELLELSITPLPVIWGYLVEVAQCELAIGIERGDVASGTMRRREDSVAEEMLERWSVIQLAHSMQRPALWTAASGSPACSLSFV